MSEPANRRLPDSLTPSFVGPLRVVPKSRPRRSWPYPVNGYETQDARTLNISRTDAVGGGAGTRRFAARIPSHGLETLLPMDDRPSVLRDCG